jgi:hypothetical protein
MAEMRRGPAPARDDDAKLGAHERATESPKYRQQAGNGH